MHEGNSTLEGWVCAGGNNEQGKCGRYCTVQYRAGPGASGGTCNSNWRGAYSQQRDRIVHRIQSDRGAVRCTCGRAARPPCVAVRLTKVVAGRVQVHKVVSHESGGLSLCGRGTGDSGREPQVTGHIRSGRVSPVSTSHF
jgi:hypothetical protein